MNLLVLLRQHQGLPSSFLKHAKLPVVPDDVWLVDLDAALIKPPSSPQADTTIPALPQPEGSTLRSQLKQVIWSHGSVEPG